jgi:hypothetical protein
MNAPNINVWGPALWSLLHGLAEKTGFKPTEKVEGEEKRLWRSLLMTLRHSIPCPRCQKHYNDYVNQNPYHTLFAFKGGEWGSALRTYLWTFHNAVRTTNGQSLDFPVERLETYRTATKANLIEWKRLYADNMRKGLPFYFLTREDMLRCLRLIEELLLFLV